jgi:hypothetical protein
MNFVYQGFTHNGSVRAFVFHGVEQAKLPAVFSIEVDLPLFARNRVAMQDAPMFCLQMLTNAFAAGGTGMEKFEHYTVVESDLRSLLVDREKRAALKALKPAPRRFVRKPPATSQLRWAEAPETR